MFESFELLAAKVSNIAIIRAIRRGLLYLLPLVLISSFTLLLLNLPVAAFQNMMLSVFGEHWKAIPLQIHKGSFQIMAVTALLSISYVYAEEFPVVKSGEVNGVFVLLTSLASFIAFTKETDTVISFQNSSSTGLFLAVLVALASTRLFLFFYKHRPFRLTVFAYDSDVMLMAALRNFLPSLFTVTVFASLRAALTLSGASALLERLSAGLTQTLTQGGTGLLTALGYIVFTHLLWFVGLHGTNILDGVVRSLFLSASEVNIALAAAGQAPTQILTKEFFDVFVYLGGCGATLGLLIALTLSGKKSNVYKIASYSFPPGLFNINDTVVYGLPIIFNPFYFIPFLLTPIALSAVSYAAMALGLVPLTIHRVEWTTPIFISGYASTGSVAGIVLQAVNLVVAILIYLPFVRLFEKNFERRHADVFKVLVAEMQQELTVGHRAVLNRNDEVGTLARTLATELEATFRGEDKTLHLEYQPQVTGEGRVTGAEALLRWEHPIYGNISPLVVLSLCDEAKLEPKLGSWVMNQGFGDLRRWHEKGYTGLHLSVNLSPIQLREDANLVHEVKDCIAYAGLDPVYMQLELTEHAAVDQSPSTRHKLEEIRAAGVSLAIDDFGMGNSSLLYLRDFFASIVKIDISLVRLICSDPQSREIVRSILTLCAQLGVKVVAEGVETADQLRILQEMGCECYQGFFFSRSLPFEKFLAFVDEHGMAESRGSQ